MLDDLEPERPVQPVAIGDVIHSKYRVERVIGEGGMGVVVAAKHLTLDRSVAIKLLSSKSRESQEALERFTREARAAARIQSEHVGRVLDVDTLPSGAPFIVMELLDGHDLADELRAHTSLPVARAVTFILQACEAIAEAHAAGIVHRDLKPANLFLTKSATGDPTVKVLDFGISKVTRREDSGATTDDKALTNAGAMLGSPLYMSPEQMKASAEVDSRTDIWSLGVILYELVTGRSPFDAKTIPVICASVLSQPPPPLDLPSAPPGFEKVILRCLEKDAAKRYRDIAHLVRALSPFAPEQGATTLDRIVRLRDEQGKPAASPATIPPPSKEGSLTITSWGEKAPVMPKRRWLPLAFAGVGAMLIGAFAIMRAVVGKAEAPPPAVAAAADAPTAATTVDAPKPAITAATSTAAASADKPEDPAGSASAESTVSASASVTAPAPPATAVRNAPPVYRPPPKSTGQKSNRGFGGRE